MDRIRNQNIRNSQMLTRFWLLGAGRVVRRGSQIDHSTRFGRNVKLLKWTQTADFGYIVKIQSISSCSCRHNNRGQHKSLRSKHKMISWCIFRHATLLQQTTIFCIIHQWESSGNLFLGRNAVLKSRKA